MSPAAPSRLALPLALLTLAVGFVGFAAGYRLSRSPTAVVDGAAPPSEVAEPEVVEDVPATVRPGWAEEANAYRTTCSLCHQRPSPKLYDAEGWRGIGRKMKERMGERMDAAVTYLGRHGRPTLQFPPTAPTTSPSQPAP